MAQLHRTEDLLWTTKDGILLTGCSCEDGQLQTDENSKQESMICVVDSNDILFDVTSSDLLVHSISMVNGM